MRFGIARLTRAPGNSDAFRRKVAGCAPGLTADADSLPVIAVVTPYLDALVEAVMAVAMVMAVVAAIVAGLRRCAGGQNCGSGKNRDC